MKLVLLLLACSITATLQEPQFKSYWAHPSYWLPSLYGYDEPPLPAERYFNPKHFSGSRIRPEDLELLKSPTSSSAEGRVNFLSNKKKDDDAENRAFPLRVFGWNALLNYAVNSITGTTSTSTVYSTTYSTITVGTLVTCYKSNLFLSTTACRRRRRQYPDILSDSIDPSSPDAIEASIEARIREERMVDGHDVTKFIIESSKEEEPRDTRQARTFVGDFELLTNLDETILLTTSTLTSFSLYTSTMTRTMTTNYVATSALTCLPACFTLC